MTSARNSAAEIAPHGSAPVGTTKWIADIKRDPNNHFLDAAVLTSQTAEAAMTQHNSHSATIRLRISPEIQDALRDYCQSHEVEISDTIRSALVKLIERNPKRRRELLESMRARGQRGPAAKPS